MIVMTCKYCGYTNENACLGGDCTFTFVAPEVCSNPECIAEMEFDRNAVWYVCRNCKTEFKAISPQHCPEPNCKSANIVTMERIRTGAATAALYRESK